MKRDKPGPPSLIDELVAALERAGVEVRVDRLAAAAPGTRSGLIALKGRKIFFLDPGQDLDEIAAALVDALARLDLEDFYLSPAARRLVEERGERGGG